MSPRIGSLFSGYGGLDMGVTAALGGSVAWHVEFDKAPSKILAHHWPDVPNYGDITTVDWSAVEPVDILTGGSPCQDLSHAGKRQGMTEGTRSNLWVAMREAIAALRPSLVVWENVRGAYSAAADSELESNPRLLADTRRRDGEPVLRALGRVLGDLSELGYDCRWHGLRAADAGAPHGRFRVFVVATDARSLRRGAGWPAVAGEAPRRGAPADAAGRGLLPTPRATRGGSSTETVGLLPTPSVADGMGGHLTRSGARSDELLLPGVAKLLGTPRASDWKGSGPVGSKSHEHMHDRDYLTAQVQRLLPTPTSQAAKHDADDRGPGTLDDGNLWSVVTREQDWGIYADAIARWEALTRPAPPPTQLSEAYLKMRAKRVAGLDKRPVGRRGSLRPTPQLSPAFSEWLMGLPAGHVTDVPGLSRNDQLKALGNGVVPQQAEAALRFLLSVERAA